MSDWLVARKVSTPDILSDVEKYCGILLTAEEFDSIEPTNANKLILLAERLEFIEHLLALHKVISQETIVKNRVVKPISGNREFVEVEDQLSCVLWGHDFAGANFDIEAMVFYLLLTCIDTIKGQPEYVDAFDWLSDPANMKLIENQDQTSLQAQLANLQVAYKTDFGITRRFVEAFVEDLPDDLQQQLVESLIVVKVRDGEITPESITAWNQREVRSKLKKLGGKLYAIRSSFTHKSLRTFLPVHPLEFALGLAGEQLLCKSGVSLLSLLAQTVRCLIKSQLVVQNNETSA